MKNIQYVKGKAATILWLIKLLTGLVSAYLIYEVFKGVYPVIKEIRITDIAFSAALAEVWAEILKEFNLSLSSFGITLKDMTSFSIYTAALMYFLLYPIIVVIEAVAATALRFAHGGVRVLRAMQFFSMFAWGVLLVDTLIVTYRVNTGDRTLLPAASVMTNVLLLITILYELIVFCYHKDMVRALSAVKANMNGDRKKLKKTHLSGISIFRGIVWLLFFAAILFSFTDPGDGDLMPFVALEGVIAAHAIKFLAVAACNRQIKSYNKK